MLKLRSSTVLLVGAAAILALLILPNEARAIPIFFQLKTIRSIPPPLDPIHLCTCQYLDPVLVPPGGRQFAIPCTYHGNPPFPPPPASDVCIGPVGFCGGGCTGPIGIATRAGNLVFQRPRRNSAAVFTITPAGPLPVACNPVRVRCSSGEVVGEMQFMEADLSMGTADADVDGAQNSTDTCPLDPNPDQADHDGDGKGDACDNCQEVSNPTQEDSDLNGIGDACEAIPDNCPFDYNPDQSDSDGDGVGNVCDNCPFVPNENQIDSDLNGFGDTCFAEPDALTDLGSVILILSFLATAAIILWLRLGAP